MLLSDDERAQLERWTRRATSAQALALRARIVLACAGPEVPPIVAVARELRVTADTVRKWRRRFLAERLDGLVDEPRPGRPPTISVEQVEAVVVTTLEQLPKNATHWSRKSMAQHSGRSKSTVGRIWRQFQLKPHLADTFKLAHAECPVVLVRAGEQATDEHETDPAGIPSAETRYRPVVLGLDVDHLDASVIDFAFDEAVRRDTGLRVVHGWSLPPYYLDGPTTDLERYDQVAHWHASALGEALNPWRQKYPSLDVVEEFRTGSPTNLLIGASRTASLVVVGRRIRRHPFGAHIGPVTHAVLHHATAPVAVVAHD